MGEELAWETVERSSAYTCGGFDVVSERVRLPDGSEAPFDYVAAGESVVVLPLTPARRVVVIEEWRQAVGRVSRGLPAGSLEPGDADPEAAARRELAEETGYRAERVSPLATVEPANGFSDAVFHYYVGHGCEPRGDQDLDHAESIRVETASLGALLEAVRTGRLRDGRSAFALLQYACFGDDALDAPDPTRVGAGESDPE